MKCLLHHIQWFSFWKRFSRAMVYAIYWSMLSNDKSSKTLIHRKKYQKLYIHVHEHYTWTLYILRFYTHKCNITSWKEYQPISIICIRKCSCIKLNAIGIVLEIDLMWTLHPVRYISCSQACAVFLIDSLQTLTFMTK